MTTNRQVEFNGQEAARIAGLPYRSLRQWMASGMIEPSLTRGPFASFGPRDVVALRAARKLRDQGLTSTAQLSRFIRLVQAVPATTGLIGITPDDVLDLTSTDVDHLRSILFSSGSLVLVALEQLDTILAEGQTAAA